jgi:predicted dehydrogenase
MACYHGHVQASHLNVGVVGLGFMGATHIDAIESLDSVHLVAVASRNAKTISGDFTGVGGNLGLEGKRYDFSKVKKHAGWRELIDDPAVDALDICLPTHLHRDVAIAALKAGKHVLCEKPMALSPDEAKEMIGEARKARRVLMVAHVLRFWPEYNALREFLRDKSFGPVKAACFTRRCGLPDWSGWLPNEAQSGGAVRDLLIHDIDQAISLFGVPETVEARDSGPVDTMAAIFAYTSQVKVRIEGGWLPAGAPFAMGFAADREEASMRLEDGVLTVIKAGSSSPLADSRFAITPANAYAEEIRYFSECCLGDETPDRCPPEDSLRAVQLAVLLEESRRGGGRLLPCTM